MFVKLLVTLFVLFAVSRVWLRFRDGSIGIFGSLLWTALWTSMAVVAWLPQVSEFIANRVGIGRGVDFLVYTTLVGLLYGVFRLYIKMEFIEHELTSLVRNLALKEEQERAGKR